MSISRVKGFKMQCEMSKGDKNANLMLTYLNMSGFIILLFLHIVDVGVHLDNAWRYGTCLW